MSASNQNTSRWTPVDDHYPSCDRTCASLVVYPETLRHEDITGLLRIQPTECQNVGEELVSQSGAVRVAKLTMWSLSSDGLVGLKDLRTHLDWLLERLTRSKSAVQELQHEVDVKMAVSCAWWSKGGTGGPTIWPEQMQMLADLNLELTVDVQFYPDEGPATF